MRTILISGLLFWNMSAFADEPVKTETPEKEPMTEFDFAQQQRALFNKADLNFDGRITRDESLMARFEEQKKGYEKRFKELDENFSGFLEPAEVERWHMEQSQKRIERLPNQREQLLKTYDLDKNGTISSYELDQVFEERAEKEKKKALPQAERDFNNKDKDKSGSVSLEEYIQSKAPRSSTERLQKMKSNALVQDGNGDGVITRSENEVYMGKVFDHLDKNNDGELSAQEQNKKIMSTFGGFQPNSIFLLGDEFPGVSVKIER